MEAAGIPRKVPPPPNGGEVDSAIDRPPPKENVPGTARQLPPDRPGPAEVDRPGAEPGVIAKGRLLRRRGRSALSRRDPENVADLEKDEYRDGPGRGHRNAVVAPPVHFGRPGGFAGKSFKFQISGFSFGT